jgi:hypothetical protein
MVKQQKPIIINNFNQGGLADSKWSGIKYSLYKMLGLDPHSAPGILRTAQAMALDTATTVDELCKARVASSNGCHYWGSSTSGKIWECDENGDWTLVYTMTLAGGEGGVNILYLFEYSGYIYVATEKYLHRIVATTKGATAWESGMVKKWATFGVGDTQFHPMIRPVDVLYIGGGNQVAQVDGDTFSANALDIVAPLRIKSLGSMGTDLLIGTYVNDNVTSTQLIRWNTWSVSFDVTDPINEVGINAFLQADNYVYVQCGNAGNIYQYDGSVLNLIKSIPGDYSGVKQMTVNPAAVGNIGNQILFGVSNIVGDPCDQGVYRIARNSTNYPYILDFPYPVSERDGDELVLSGIEIGAVLVVGSDIFVAWKHTASGPTYTYGIDKLDYATKLDGAYFESKIVIASSRDTFANIAKMFVAYSLLPADTAIEIQYSKNYEAYVPTDEKIDSMRNVVQAEEGIEATTLQLKVIVTTDGNDAPEIENATIVPR